MPLPKVPNGQKISLMLPAEVVRRIKLEALDTGSLPAVIVQKALEAYCREGLAAYKVPRRIEFIDEMPVEAAKIRKRDIVVALKEDGLAKYRKS